jgi:DNA-binding response OmpR family regulator
MIRTILLVEDDRDDEELTCRSLREAGIRNQIAVARDGAAALESLFGDQASLPALVLLDLKLPKLDGFDVLRRIRADSRTRSLPVVILTSSDADEDVMKSYELGVNSYVRKPVGFAEFARTVGELGLYWLILSESPLRDGHDE